MNTKCRDNTVTLQKARSWSLATAVLWACIMIIGNGCVSIPTSSVKEYKLTDAELWSKSGGWDRLTRDGEISNIRDLSVSTKVDNEKLRVTAIISQDQLSWRHRTERRQSRAVVGIFPMLHYDIGNGTAEDQFAIIALAGIPCGLFMGIMGGNSYKRAEGLFCILMQPTYLAASILASPINWIAEPFSKPDGDEFWDYALVGFCKTEKKHIDKSRRDDLQVRTFTDPVKIDCIVTFAGSNAVWSSNGRRESRHDIDLSKLPIIDSQAVSLSLTVSVTNDITTTTNIIFPANQIGTIYRTNWSNIPTVLWYYGERLNFAKGPLDAAPQPQASFEIVKTDNPGGMAELRVVVENTGRGPLYRFVGVTQSERNELHSRVIPFGRVDPGQTITRTLPLPIPKDMKPGTYPLQVEFHEANNYVPGNAMANLTVLPFDKPALAFSFRVEDDPAKGEKIVGNADGVIQKGEAFDLIVTLKNTGKAVAKDVSLEVTLPEDASLRVFGGRCFGLGDLAVGEVAERRVNVSLRLNSNLSELPVTIQTEEKSFSVKEKQDASLPFDTRIARQPIALNTTFYVGSDQTVLREGAAETATEFGIVRRGTILRAVAELDDWVQVEVESSTGADTTLHRLWVFKNALTSTPPTGVVSHSDGIQMTRFEAPAPMIAFVRPGGEKFTTDEDLLNVIVSVVDTRNRLDEVRMFREGVEITTGAERGLHVRPVQIASGRGDERVVEYSTSLELGTNLITLTAVNNAGKTATRTLTAIRIPKIGKIYAISIGINQYPAPHPLSAARTDAEAYHHFVREQMGVAEDRAFLLTDQAATRQKIIDTFDRVFRDAKPEDSILVFMAGHGVTEARGIRNESYFVPADGKWGSLLSTAIRLEDFDAMLATKAQRVLILADFCNSSSAIKVRGYDEIFSHLAGQGRIALGHQGSALEDQRLKHGYLTHYWLEGISGPADTNGDGIISVREAYEYANRLVKKRTGASLWIQGEGDMQLLRTKTGKP